MQPVFNEFFGSSCLHSTGGYERKLASAMHAAGVPIVVANPRQVREFAGGNGILEKSDPIDASVLRAFGEDAQPNVGDAEIRRSTEAGRVGPSSQTALGHDQLPRASKMKLLVSIVHDHAFHRLD